MSDEHQLIYRAQSLMELQRFDQALELLQGALASNPENEQAHFLMLICLTQLGKTQRAIEQARQLLARFPNEPLLYQLLAANLADSDALGEAQQVAQQGLTVAPGNVDLLATLGQIALGQKEWERALQHAEQVLELDPSHLTGLNIRLTALNKLGRRHEVQNSLNDTLAADPNNPYTHNNIGWTHLEAGDHEQAKQHFAEALRLQPNLDEARIGLLESLKAKNILYRGFLNWMFFMSKQKEQAQWFIIIGAYLGYRFLAGLTQDYPFLIPVVILIALLFYLTWVVQPISNLLIKLDPVARHALTSAESRAATIVGTGLSIGMVLLITYSVIGGSMLLITGLFALSIVIPTYMYLDFEKTTKENIAKRSMQLLWVLGIASIGLIAIDSNGGPGPQLWSMYLLGFIAYQFAANYWRMRAQPVD